MQNLKSKIIFIVVLVLCIFSFFAISKVAIIHNNDTDSIKFKEEYESLNGKKYKNKKIRDVKIEKDNPFVYKTAEEIVDLIENGESFIVYFGFSKCPWCRSIIETFIKTAKENNIDKIYYVDIEEIRNVIEYDKDGNLVTTKNGTPDYYDLVNKLNSVLNQYTLNNNGEEVAIGEKRIYAPNVVLVNNGEPVEMIDPIENIIKDPASEITKEQKEEMSNKIKCLFSCMKKGNTCSIKTKC